MTHPALILTPEGILLIDAPEKPDDTPFRKTDDLDGFLKLDIEYNVALASAIENGGLLDNDYFVDGINTIGFVTKNMELNKPYPIPEGWEPVIEYGCKKCGAHLSVEKINCENPYCEKFKIAKLIKKENITREQVN